MSKEGRGGGDASNIINLFERTRKVQPETPDEVADPVDTHDEDGDDSHVAKVHSLFREARASMSEGIDAQVAQGADDADDKEHMDKVALAVDALRRSLGTKDDGEFVAIKDIAEAKRRSADIFRKIATGYNARRMKEAVIDLSTWETPDIVQAILDASDADIMRKPTYYIALCTVFNSRRTHI